ncbi:putative integral membrane protein (TIGR02206 family) [Crossiella equi]|uniref:Integral membrane protein (TIGR02206 family) n=1 Tax=Crossiella equi TaxID=130796 RepID=A0ABS5ACP9_9PSEU|nr:TIGR02206 family membrane protein [Crossiella equi]MBP2474344.1 putative integral membrane protein (TIGR02206 family) [Crossiella equi]
MSPLAAPFEPYGPSHWGAVAVFALGAAALVLLGRGLPDAAAGKRFSRGLAVVLLACHLPLQLWTLLPSEFGIGHSLPFQLSDLAWISAVVALWTHRWWALALTYYWNLVLTPQALLTPALSGEDFPSFGFLMFWGQHIFMVWAAIFLTWGLKLRPDWRSYRFTLLVTAVWALVVSGFNALAGTNYGFLSEKPPVGSLLDLMGGWPWYLFVGYALLAGAWSLMTWPWVRHTARSAQPA